MVAWYHFHLFLFLDHIACYLGIKEALHSATLCSGEDGVLHGMRTKVLQNRHGQILESSSIAAGLDYAGVGPELAYLADIGRLRPCNSMDNEALDAFNDLCMLEGIIPALESSPVKKAAATGELGDVVVINLSGRGDKDLETVMGMRK